MEPQQEKRFRNVYKVLATCGICDEVDSQEYRRVLGMWKDLLCPRPIGAFIVQHANRVSVRQPDGTFPAPHGTRECPECNNNVPLAWIKGRCLYQDHMQWVAGSGTICEWSGLPVDAPHPAVNGGKLPPWIV